MNLRNGLVLIAVLGMSSAAVAGKKGSKTDKASKSTKQTTTASNKDAAKKPVGQNSSDDVLAGIVANFAGGQEVADFFKANGISGATSFLDAMSQATMDPDFPMDQLGALLQGEALKLFKAGNYTALFQLIEESC